MPVFRQSRDCDVRDVIGVYEGFPDIPDRQDDLAADHRVPQPVLAEVLGEHSTSQDRPVRRRLKPEHLNQLFTHVHNCDVRHVLRFSAPDRLGRTIGG